MQEELKLISSKEFSYYKDMYKVVDYLNKNLNDLDIVIGLSIEENTQWLNIYKQISKDE